eukprot:TRINITY_DN2307_c0_g1_i1.p1 TRINITY_DN2307_c0_g1~~TRINITY_DN2307_c0_g1_i1.p1  ORF type:complete len:531 (-),score=72.88 TRINITY_DN2307_c0_g1_i1:26-1420(-)
MSKRIGAKYDDPASAKDILPFITYHNLNMSEFTQQPHEFKTFNEFFYRKLRPGARDIAKGDVVVSPADCRCVVFRNVDEATQLWIKGKEFSLRSLLNDEELAARFEGGALAVFRLAPQDYHRYHHPVQGIVGKTTEIDGNYYTVNPAAVKRKVNVFGENIRNVTQIELGKDRGTMAYVCIGATMVGSICLTDSVGWSVEKGEEHGYFKFGGSTIVLVFQKNVVQWSDDLLQNSSKAVPIEMLIKMGSQIATFTDDRNGNNAHSVDSMQVKSIRQSDPQQRKWHAPMQQRKLVLSSPHEAQWHNPTVRAQAATQQRQWLAPTSPQGKARIYRKHPSGGGVAAPRQYASPPLQYPSPPLQYPIPQDQYSQAGLLSSSVPRAATPSQNQNRNPAGVLMQRQSSSYPAQYPPYPMQYPPYPVQYPPQYPTAQYPSQPPQYSSQSPQYPIQSSSSAKQNPYNPLHFPGS